MKPAIATREITAHDLLKTFAVATMIVDHVGFYFFPEDMLWRAFGRMSFPVWFFLVGYSARRDAPADFIIGAAILIAANVVTGFSILPLSALVTIAAIRLTLEPLLRYIMKAPAHLWLAGAALALLAFPTYFITEYGSIGWMMAVFGHLIRRRKEIADDNRVEGFMIFVLTVYIICQQIFFGFTTPEFIVMAGGAAAVFLGLSRFSAGEINGLAARMPQPAVMTVRFCGRRTLEIYVAHLVVFKMAALMMGDDRAGLFSVTWF
jgi:hypothetical protein